MAAAQLPATAARAATPSSMLGVFVLAAALATSAATPSPSPTAVPDVLLPYSFDVTPAYSTGAILTTAEAANNTVTSEIDFSIALLVGVQPQKRDGDVCH